MPGGVPGVLGRNVAGPQRPARQRGRRRPTVSAGRSDTRVTGTRSKPLDIENRSQKRTATGGQCATTRSEEPRGDFRGNGPHNDESARIAMMHARSCGQVIAGPLPDRPRRRRRYLNLAMTYEEMDYSVPSRLAQAQEDFHLPAMSRKIYHLFNLEMRQPRIRTDWAHLLGFTVPALAASNWKSLARVGPTHRCLLGVASAREVDRSPSRLPHKALI
jgi:hypothetical protein